MTELSPDFFPIQPTMPLSFETRAKAGPKVDFGELVMNALGEVNEAKELAFNTTYDVYILGKDTELHTMAINDEIHGQKKAQMQGVIRTHQNLFQTMMNMQL